MESAPDDVTLLNFSRPTEVPLFENATDIVTFPDDEAEDEDDDSGLVVFVHPASPTAMNNKPMNFRDGIFKLLF
jgi:hypothetical protein